MITGTSAPRLRGSVSVGRPQWVRSAVHHLQVYLLMWVWLWAIVVVGAALAIAVVDRVGTVNVSMVQFVRTGPLVWFLFSIAVIVATTYLTAHVANGMTRRSFLTGGLVAAVSSSVLHAVTAAGLLLLEGVLYDRMGWQHDAEPGEEYTAGVWESGLGTLLVDHALLALSGTLTGLLVGITYYRLGGWWGTLALPLTISPILAVMFLTSWTEAPFVPFDAPGWSAYLVGAVLVLAAGLAFALLVRRVPIARTES
ncbi:hypothetical protein M3148_12190 [Georgenia satyanarayanai]|uniref:hypothetical protein n=1 Tax=Georgenia satyanarayanai TaxID=860221 RepID=UPI00203DD767|nr:hypothetical protein [Georgenia satyanarayanai]MCM3661740.1 hypothetical protein [Georgenia satyanarayanai]